MNFSFLDTSRHAEEREFEVSAKNQLAKRRAAYNKGLALRKALLGTSSTVNTEIPLNRYSFFEMLEDELLPNTRVEINFAIESDGNLIWQAGADCRVVFTRTQLYVIFDLETALNTAVANNANQKKIATDLLLITAERLHHSTGIMLESVLILEEICWLMEIKLHKQIIMVL